MAAATAVYGQAIISNGTIGMGVDINGQLNIPGPASAQGTTYYGLRFLPTNNEATAPGCICEGWGAADAGLAVTGWADNAAAPSVGVGLTPISFASTASTATTVSEVGSILRVTHEFKPSATPNLYEVTVSLENISGGNLSDIRYTRAMDWDVEPTAFNEFSTIQGATAATAVLYSDNNGFEIPDPLGSRSSFGYPNVDFIDAGPADHGAVFDFGFGALADGDTFSFKIFYGAAATELEALAALGVVGAEVYSFGQPNLPGGPDIGAPNTFIFAFKGVGGVIIVDPPVVPEANTHAAGIALAGLVGASIWRRRQARK